MNPHKTAADYLRDHIELGWARPYEVAMSEAIALLEWRAGEPSDEDLAEVVSELRLARSGARPRRFDALSAAIGLIERLASLR